MEHPAAIRGGDSIAFEILVWGSIYGGLDDCFSELNCHNKVIISYWQQDDYMIEDHRCIKNSTVFKFE